MDIWKAVFLARKVRKTRTRIVGGNHDDAARSGSCWSRERGERLLAKDAGGERGGDGLTDGLWSARSPEPPLRRAQTPAERGPSFSLFFKLQKRGLYESRAVQKSAPHPRGFDVFRAIVFYNSTHSPQLLRYSVVVVVWRIFSAT